MTLFISIGPSALLMLTELVGDSEEFFTILCNQLGVEKRQQQKYLKLPAELRVPRLVGFLQTKRKEFDSELWAKAIHSINSGNLGYVTACRCGCREDFLWCCKEETLTISIPRDIMNHPPFISPPPYPERPLNEVLFPPELTK